MAGISLYNDLKEALIASDSIEIPQKVESVKILPPTGEILLNYMVPLQNRLFLWQNWSIRT